MDLRGQRVVALGGTSGIGFATAASAAEHGADVTVVSSRRASVDQAIDRLPSGAQGYVADLTDADQVKDLLAGLGQFDHLVYTAGEPLTLMSLDALELDAAQNAFTLRYFGALAAVHAAVPHMRPAGSITLTTGVAKDRPRPGWAVSASICGAVEALTRALAVELAPIRVNAVSPGVVRSPLWSGMSEADQETMYKQVGAGLLVGRVGEVDEIARAYLFLLTEPFATGTVLTVDGGTILV